MAQNVIVDDLDLTFSAGWKASADCKECSAAPNADQMRFVNKGTWHDAARQANGDPVSMTYTFEGTGVTVYGITVNGTNARPVIKNVDLVFSLDDDAQAGAFTYTPDKAITDYHFNVPLFTKQGLANGRHTVKMELQPHSFILLDYLVYTKEAAVKPDPPPTDPNSGTTPNTGDNDPTDGNTGNTGSNDTDNDNDNKDDNANNGGTNTNDGSNSFAGPGDSSPQSTGAGAQLPGPSSTSNGGGLSTQTAITLAVLIPIVVAVIVIAVFFWWLRRRSAKRHADVLAAAQIPPPPEFYGGPGRASTVASYHHPGSPAGMQFNPYAPGQLRGGSTYANPSNPFAPSSHVPSSITDEDMDIASAAGGAHSASAAYAGIVAAGPVPPPVMREKRGMPPNIQPQQYGPVPPLYSP